MFRVNNAARILPVALLLSIFACKKKEVAPADSLAVDTGAMVAPVAALRVSGIETGKGVNADKSIKDDAHDFGVRDTIYASVKTEGAGTGKLAAKWTTQAGQPVGEETVDIAPTVDGYHEFHMAKATPWPKGDYKVEIILDGVSAGTKDFTIK